MCTGNNITGLPKASGNDMVGNGYMRRHEKPIALRMLS